MIRKLVASWIKIGECLIFPGLEPDVSGAREKADMGGLTLRDAEGRFAHDLGA